MAITFKKGDMVVSVARPVEGYPTDSDPMRITEGPYDYKGAPAYTVSLGQGGLKVAYATDLKLATKAQAHSPAPWTNHGYKVTNAQGVTIARLQTTDLGPVQYRGNGALITASPELLDLVKAYAAGPDPETWEDLTEKANKLIAQIDAKGGR